MENRKDPFIKDDGCNQAALRDPVCDCGHALSYESDIGAPGYGQSWGCPKCKNKFHKVGDHLTNWKDVDPEIFETLPCRLRNNLSSSLFRWGD